MTEESNEQQMCLLGFGYVEDLIDSRIREQKIYTNCINTLLEQDFKPDNSDINLRIRDLCIELDQRLEKYTLLDREEKGTPYQNDATGIKLKPIPYKELNVSLAESGRLAEIYENKYNEIQIRKRQDELQDFPKTPNLELFNCYMNELQALYNFTEKDIMYITHWLTNVKRTILDKSVELPQILCFTSHKQYIGKSFLASIITKIINKRIITTDLIKLSARFQPLTLATESVLWIDELKKIDRTISDNIKTLITSETIDFEYKGKNGFKQLKKMASIIMSINYDPSNIFFEDESQRRIAIIQFNGYTKKKTKEELETLIKNLWDNSPIEYIISPDLIAELTFNEKKENSILENFACERIARLFEKDSFFSVSEIMNNLYSYNGGRNKLKAFLKNEDYFIQEYKANRMLVFKATDTFKELLKELLKDKEEMIDHYIYDFARGL
jgi:hypothetical protein